MLSLQKQVLSQRASAPYNKLLLELEFPPFLKIHMLSKA